MNTVQLSPVPPAGPPVGPRAGPPVKSHKTRLRVTARVASAKVVLGGGIGALAGSSGHVTAKAAATATQSPVVPAVSQIQLDLNSGLPVPGITVAIPVSVH
jgi:predicted Rossmann-fold nucleotide-binding protein